MLCNTSSGALPLLNENLACNQARSLGLGFRNNSSLYSVPLRISERRKGIFCEDCLYVGVVIKSASGQAREKLSDIINFS